jgi:hypothetical protein
LIDALNNAFEDIRGREKRRSVKLTPVGLDATVLGHFETPMVSRVGERLSSGLGSTKGAQAQLIKPFRFDTLAVFSFASEREYFAILGFKLPKTKYDQFPPRVRRFVSDWKSANRKTQIDFSMLKESFDYSRDRNYSTYGAVVQSYKRLLLGDDIARVNLFLFNAFDRRLYYQSIDARIEDADIERYFRRCVQFASEDISLSDSQKRYIMNRIKDSFKLTEHQRNFSAEILDNLHDPKWVRDQFKSSAENSAENRMILRQVFTCIPQEPWTGVAGYSAWTKTMDVSRQAQAGEEVRWNPQRLDQSYFYRRLTLYEILLGVGGGGTMFSFPITDCGQISGVLFVTSKAREKYKFKPEILHNLLNLTAVLKQLIMSRKEFDFSMQVIDTLINKPNDYDEPMEVIVRYIYMLFNPALVVAWQKERGSKDRLERPRYVYAYQRPRSFSVEESEGDTLIPLHYLPVLQSDPLLQAFSAAHYATIRHLSDDQKELLDLEEVRNSLPKDFHNIYQRESDRGVIDNSKQSVMRTQVESGILLRYSWQRRPGFIVVYTTDSVNDLSEQIGFIRKRREMIENLVRFEEGIFHMFERRRATIHDVSSGFIYTTKFLLDKANAKLESATRDLKDDLELVDLVTRAQALITLVSKNFIASIEDALTRIDENLAPDRKKKPLCLYEVVKSIVPIMKDYWATYDSNPIYFDYIQLGDIIGVRADSEESEKALITANEVELWRTVFNLLNNIYNGKVLPHDLITADPDRAKVTICISKLTTDYLCLSITDNGKGMDEKIRDWALAVFDEVKDKFTNPDIDPFSKRYLSSDLRRKYKNIKNAKETHHGFGLFNVASCVYNASSPSYPSKDLISLQTEPGRMTRITMMFPIAKKED